MKLARTISFPLTLSWLFFSLLILVLQNASAHPTNNTDSKAHQHLNRRTTNLGGLHVLGNNCHASDSAAIYEAMRDAGILAEAALNAASNLGAPPFSYFFKSDHETAAAVAGVYQRVKLAVQGHGALILTTCADIFNKCVAQDGTGRAAYAGQLHPHTEQRTPLIVMCPWGLTFSGLRRPCQGSPGAEISILGALMLHELVHTLPVSAPARTIIDTTSVWPKDIHADLMTGMDTTTVAMTYSMLATWSWDLGLSGPPQEPCWSQFLDGNFDGSRNI